MFDTPDEAAAALCRAAYRASATPSRPRAPIPIEGEPVTGGPLDEAFTLWDRLTGPSSNAEDLFRDVAADWVAFERAGVPAQYPELRADHERWIRFRDAWHRGQADPKELRAYALDANRVRRSLYDRTKDPRFGGPDRDIGTLEQTPTAKVGEPIDLAVRAVEAAIPKPGDLLPDWPNLLPDWPKFRLPTWEEIPTWIKVAGGFVLAGYVTSIVMPIAIQGGTYLYVKHKLQRLSPTTRAATMTAITGNPAAGTAVNQLL